MEQVTITEPLVCLSSFFLLISTLKLSIIGKKLLMQSDFDAIQRGKTVYCSFNVRQMQSLKVKNSLFSIFLTKSNYQSVIYLYSQQTFIRKI